MMIIIIRKLLPLTEEFFSAQMHYLSFQLSQTRAVFTVGHVYNLSVVVVRTQVPKTNMKWFVQRDVTSCSEDVKGQRCGVVEPLKGAFLCEGIHISTCLRCTNPNPGNCH